MDFEFVIPQARQDLLRSGRVRQYVVEELLPVRQLAEHMNEFKTAFQVKGPLAVVEHFDVAFSVLCHFKLVEPALQEQTLNLLVKVVLRHSSELPEILEDRALSSSQRLRHLNVLKMSCYLLTQLVEAFEERSVRLQLSNVGPTGKARKPKGRSPDLDWDSERVSVLHQLTQLLQLDLRWLWAIGIVEADFCRIISACCYRLLETPSVAHAKNKPTREAVAHVLGQLIKRYNHMLGATLNVIQFLQHFEHSPPVLVHIVSIWATEYDNKTIVGEIMREIVQCAGEDGARESVGVRSFGAFLAELSEAIPGAMIPNVSLILDFLNRESYVLRNAVLSSIAHMLTRGLSGPQLDQAGRSLRDGFLDALQLHIHDAHALVRSRSLQLLTRVVQEKALPLKRFHPVVTLATGRLCDKAINVCKNAIQLLASILANNPFSGKLSIDDLRLSLEKERSKLKELREERAQATAVSLEPSEEWEAMKPELLVAIRDVLREEEEEEDGEEGSDGEEGPDDSPQSICDHIARLLKAAKYKPATRLAREAVQRFPEVPPFLAPTSDVAESEDAAVLRVLEACNRGPVSQPDPEAHPLEHEEGEGISASTRQEVLVQYLLDTLTFGEKIQGAIKIVGKLLGSKNPSVVQDAIHFFVTISEFEVPGSMEGMRQMLPLICSKETGVKEAVVEAYRRLYLNPSGQRPKPLTLVQNLTALIFDSTVERIKCLEELVSEFVQKQEVDPAAIQLLWERFTEKVPCTADERRAAVILLGMAARGEPEIVGSNLETLFTVGLGSRASLDYQLARDVCQTIGKLSQTKKGIPGRSDAPFRLPSDHPLFSHLTTAVTEGFSIHSLYWCPFAEAAVTLIYHLAETPDRLCAQLLVQCCQQLSTHCSPAPLTDAPSSTDSPSSTDTQTEESSEGKDAGGPSVLPTHQLTSLVSLVGHVSLQQVVHLEQAVGPELLRRRLDQQQRVSKRRRSQRSKNVSAIEEELGLAETSAEDTEAELVRRVCDMEILEDGQLLSSFVPLVVRLCSNPGTYSDPNLATASCLALCKLAIVSHDFCESHLRLLFTLLEKSAHPEIRSNTMVALGDLCFRFPNLIEPWTPHLYARLRDSACSVRRTALVVMTHLILNDMVKVKGQISEMAALLVDEDEEITLLARSFFNELSCKGNAVYNLLPDIISRLSDPDCGIDEEPFRTVMRQMFSYITKDRQTESLVEKLCQRFRTARLERQHRDLAFCLGLLPATEKGLRKMQENFDCLADKLQEEVVYQQLLGIVAKLRKGLRPELKALVDEFEQRLSRCHSQGMDDGEPVDINPRQTQKAPSKKAERKTAGNDVSKVGIPTPRATRHPRSSRRVCVVFSSDEEEDSEEETDTVMMDCETPEIKSPIRRAQRSRRGDTACK